MVSQLTTGCKSPFGSNGTELERVHAWHDSSLDLLDLQFSDHFLRTDPSVKLVARQIAQFYCGLFQCGAVLVSGLCDFRSLLIAYFRIQRGYQHQRVFQMLLNKWSVRFDADHAVVVERFTGVTKIALAVVIAPMPQLLPRSMELLRKESIEETQQRE